MATLDDASPASIGSSTPENQLSSSVSHLSCLWRPWCCTTQWLNQRHRDDYSTSYVIIKSILDSLLHVKGYRNGAVPRLGNSSFFQMDTSWGTFQSWELTLSALFIECCIWERINQPLLQLTHIFFNRRIRRFGWAIRQFRIWGGIWDGTRMINYCCSANLWHGDRKILGQDANIHTSSLAKVNSFHPLTHIQGLLCASAIHHKHHRQPPITLELKIAYRTHNLIAWYQMLWFLTLGLFGRRVIVVTCVCPSVRLSVCLSVCSHHPC